MERSLGLRLGRSLGLALPRGVRPMSPRATRVRAPLRMLAGRRRLRIALIALLLALPLLTGGWLWLRHSSLVEVEHVHVSGLARVQGVDTAAIESALRNAARGMSTLDLAPARLRAAAASYPIVRSIQAHASFPHELRIAVIEQPPVAALVSGGARTAVAADGVALGAGLLSGALPLVDAGRGQAATLPLAGHPVAAGWQRQALLVIAAAPAQIAPQIERAYSGSKGLMLAMRGGLLAYFGDATRPHAKWLSLIRVLADPSSAGAAYVDVRLPERPAAGFTPGSARPQEAGGGEPASSSDPATASELAAGLNAAVEGGTSAAASSAPTAASEPEEATESSATGESGEATTGPASPEGKP